MKKHFLTAAIGAGIACASLSSTWAASLSDGLVGHWPMDRLHGDTLKDVSGNRRDATADGVKIVDGRDGHVLSCDGVKNAIFLPDEQIFAVTGDYGISLWVRIEADSEANAPIYAQPGFTIANFRGVLRVTFRNSDYPTTGYADLMGPKVDDGQWHHIVFSYAGNTGEAMLFDNGQAAGKRTFAHLPEVSVPTTVGFFGRFHLKGELSDLYVYSRVLDLEDVAALHNAKTASE